MKSKVMAFLYQNILKKIFFCFDAEMVHDFMTFSGEALGKTAFGKWVCGLLFYQKPCSGITTVDGIRFPGLVGLPAGFDYNARLTQILPHIGFAFETVGTVTLEPYEGNERPRLGRFPNSRALLVNKGLKSLGAQDIISHLSHMEFHIPVGISIGATNRLYKNSEEQIDNTRGFGGQN
jgi:hypothetical protein